MRLLPRILSAAAFFGVLIDLPVAANATDFTAKVVMKEMTEEQRYSYLSGVIEGLAYARYAQDGKQIAGMNCIYDGFYGTPKVTDLIYAAFGQYPDYTPGAVVSALVKRKCN